MCLLLALLTGLVIISLGKGTVFVALRHVNCVLYVVSSVGRHFGDPQSATLYYCRCLFTHPLDVKVRLY